MNAVKAIPDGKLVEYVKNLCRVDEKYAMCFNIGYSTGLRISDILSLRVKNVKKRIKVREMKTKKVKNVKLHKVLRKTIKEYVKDKKLKNNHALIPSNEREKCKPISRVQVHNIFRRTGLKMGLELISTHSMRKTYAEKIYAETGQISAVKKALNHEREKTTLRYLSPKE